MKVNDHKTKIDIKMSVISIQDPLLVVFPAPLAAFT